MKKFRILTRAELREAKVNIGQAVSRGSVAALWHELGLPAGTTLRLEWRFDGALLVEWDEATEETEHA